MIDLLKTHSSVRKYKNEPITDEEFHEMLSAAQHAASTNFVQAYSVVQIKDSEKVARMAELSNNPKQYESAALPLVFCADLKRLQTAASMHGEVMEGGTAENLLVAVIDTALFAQNFVVAAESKGYGICYIGGVRNKPAEISELLELPDHVIPLFGLTVGIPDEKNEVKPRLPVEAILHEDTYKEEKYEEILPRYDEQMNTYYRSRSKNMKDNGWTDVMAAFISARKRPHMMDYLKSKGFLKDE